MNTKQDDILQIVLAEYSRQGKRVEVSLATVNQSLSLYLTILTALAAVGTGSLALLSQRTPQLALLILSLLSSGGALATGLTLLRVFRARMEQTDADRALSRLRNYFVTQWPSLEKYISDSFYDDWPTPYSHKRRSGSFIGWMVLVILAGLFLSASVALAFAALKPQMDVRVGLILSICAGLFLSGVCSLWLRVKLEARRYSDRPRFPKPVPTVAPTLTASRT
jgi:hypothetical protein